MRSGTIISLSLFWIVFTLVHTPAGAQMPVPKAIPDAYNFIRRDLNVFTNQEEGLVHFYTQLQLLEAGKRRKVNIVHIGDSHLQADFFSGTFRKLIHQHFGAAGRGLVFPFKVARTNSPADIKAFSNTTWEVKRNVSPSRPLPIGVSGITLRTTDPNFILQLSLGKSPQNLDYTFNKVTIFNEKGPECYDFLLSDADEANVFVQVKNVHHQYYTVQKGDFLGKIADEHGITLSQLKRWNNLRGDIIFPNQKLIISPPVEGEAQADINNFRDLARIDNSSFSPSPFSTTVRLDQARSSILLRGKKTADTQKRATLFGIVLENDRQSGILYHMIGVNGAMFRHYNAAPDFFPQVRELHPDLIIISLGTNESSGTSFNESWFYKNVNRMISLLEEHAPNADILLMTPSDAYRYRKYKNPNAGKAKEVLLAYAQEHHLAAWDFYEVMGGYGAISEWYNHGLAQRDRLHLTKRGYELQGKLLYEAMMNGYREFLARGSK